MVAVVLILVVGPKDLPPMLRSFGRMVKKYRGMANDFKNQFNDALEESELDELRQTVADVKSYNPLNQVTDAVKGVGADINEAVDDANPVKPWKPKPEEISDVARSVGEKEAKAKTAAARKTAAKKTTAARKSAAVLDKKPTTAKPVAKKPAVKTAAKPAAAKAPSLAKKPAATAKKAAARKPGAKTPAAELSAAVKASVRKPRASAAKKTTTSTGKAKAK